MQACINVPFVALLANSHQDNTNNDPDNARISRIATDSIDNPIATKTGPIQPLEFVDQRFSEEFRLARSGDVANLVADLLLDGSTTDFAKRRCPAFGDFDFDPSFAHRVPVLPLAC